MAKHNAANARIKREYFIYLKEAQRRDEGSIDAVVKALARFEYATERRKRLEAEQAHTDLADKHNILLAKAYIRDGARFVRVVK